MAEKEGRGGNKIACEARGIPLVNGSMVCWKEGKPVSGQVHENKRHKKKKKRIQQKKGEKIPTLRAEPVFLGGKVGGNWGGGG